MFYPCIGLLVPTLPIIIASIMKMSSLHAVVLQYHAHLASFRTLAGVFGVLQTATNPPQTHRLPAIPAPEPQPQSQAQVIAPVMLGCSGT